MKSVARRYRTLALCLFFSALAFVSINSYAGEAGHGPGVLVAKLDAQTPPGALVVESLDAANPRVRAVMDIQDRHGRELMAIPDVVGTGTGLDDSGAPAVVVFTKREIPAGVVPRSIEGVGVRSVVTGAIYSLARGGSKTSSVSNTSAFPPPSPIGVSTGNIGECSAGTVGCRLKDGNGNLYALSNNHVYALENAASIGSTCVQPGMYDTSYCISPGKKSSTFNVIGALTTFVPINFSGGTNYVDCAVSTVVNASSGVPSLGTATPSTGYGTPNSTTWYEVNSGTPPVGLAVQKFGRTSSLTKGQIYAINVGVNVDYGTSGVGYFENQIAVYSNRAFIKAGDSGSLLVTNDSNDYPVGLLYAGNSSGSFAFANPINAVLGSLSTGSPSAPNALIPGLGIDGK